VLQHGFNDAAITAAEQQQQQQQQQSPLPTSSSKPLRGIGCLNTV
jgi:hypothetical protein